MAHTLDRETFEDIINDLITREDIKLLIELPEGTQEATVTGTGVATLDYYILMAAIIPTFVQVVRDMGGSAQLDAEAVLDGLFAMMKSDILEKLDGEA